MSGKIDDPATRARTVAPVGMSVAIDVKVRMADEAAIPLIVCDLPSMCG